MTKWINTNQRQSNGEAVVHTDLSCQYVTPMSLTEEEANVDFDELETCSECDGTRKTPQEETFACALCGDEIERYPDHLPCEESP